MNIRNAVLGRAEGVRCFIDTASLRVTAVLLSFVQAFSPALVFAQAHVAPGVNNIVPDGCTATSLSVNGNTTTITTKTLKEIAREAGFGTEDRMRGVFQRSLGVSPADYRLRFSLRQRGPCQTPPERGNVLN